MPSITTEDYVKAIYQHAQEKGVDAVPMGALATALGVSPGTITTMLKSLDARGLVSYRSRKGVKLTSRGLALALNILRRHRLIEMFLVDTLKMDWSNVHQEAERMEHAVSEEVVSRIEKLLGYPKFDPHGDPIPMADGKINSRQLVNLADFKTGESGTVARILDQSSEFLGLMDTVGFTPKMTFTVESNLVVAETLVIRTEKQTFSLGLNAARKIDAEKLSSTNS